MLKLGYEVLRVNNFQRQSCLDISLEEVRKYSKLIRIYAPSINANMHISE